jgi:hypothetical protein
MSLPNNQQADKWKVTFSNIPTVTELKDMRLYDYYVRSCVLPDYNCPFDYDNFMKGQYVRPITKANQDLTQLQIEFKVSENWTNYTNLIEFIQRSRYGQNLDVNFIKDNVVDRINVVMLDNEKRENKIIYFTKAFLTNVSSLSLIYGSSDEASFTTNWIYEEMLYEDTPDLT